MIKHIPFKSTLLTVAAVLGLMTCAHAQSAITAVGGNVATSDGSLSYSVGEVAVRSSVARAITVVNITESFTEGVQQPYTQRDLERYEGIEALTVQVSVYPNPTVDNVIIECSQTTEPLHYYLFNTNGQAMLEGVLNDSQEQLDIQSYAAGNYLLKVVSSDKKKMNVYKIIKAK